MPDQDLEQLVGGDGLAAGDEGPLAGPRPARRHHARPGPMILSVQGFLSGAATAPPPSPRTAAALSVSLSV